jgi:hypothetical protein
VARRRRRPSGRGVPWWAPLLGLLLLAGVAFGAARTGGDDERSAAPAATGGVLGTEATLTQAATTAATTTTARGRAAAWPGLEPGTTAAEHSVGVLEVVGPRIFWVGRSRSARTLVHLQGPGTRWAIRTGQRLTFTATVAKNDVDRAAAWGLTRREGRDQFSRQDVHFEVFGPKIVFHCVLRCAAQAAT